MDLIPVVPKQVMEKFEEHTRSLLPRTDLATEAGALGVIVGADLVLRELRKYLVQG